MRFLGLTLPPLTLIMLLAFLWLILLVLLLWVWLRPRRPLEPPHTPRRTAQRDHKRDARLEDNTPAQLPRPRVVREVTRDSGSPKSAAEEGDPFDAYKPNSRNDDFDF